MKFEIFSHPRNKKELPKFTHKMSELLDPSFKFISTEGDVNLAIDSKDKDSKPLDFGIFLVNANMHVEANEELLKQFRQQHGEHVIVYFVLFLPEQTRLSFINKRG